MLALTEAVRLIDRRGRLPRGAIAVTFDDGFEGVYEHAFPVLARFRLPATVFVVAGTLASRPQPVDWVDTPPPFPLTTLSRQQVLEMQRAGIAFGSHGYTHRDLTTLSDEECERDLRDSRLLLSDLLGGPIPFLAYPRGKHDRRVRGAAVRAGFTHAFSLPEVREPTGRLCIPRVGLYPGNGLAALRVKTAPWYLGVRMSRAYPMARAMLARARPNGAPRPEREAKESEQETR